MISDKMTKMPVSWNYDSESDVFWQTGIVYCSVPCADEYHTLGIFVPGAYMKAEKTSDGSYVCSVNRNGCINGYNAASAPIVMPVDTPGYSAMKSPKGYDRERVAEFTDAGFIYVHAGCRGRESGINPDGTRFTGGAPWGVTDLKAAVRWLRCNSEYLPGDTGRIFTFGHSGGGAQSSLMGASGDSPLYKKYLESIGAVMKSKNGEDISDAVYGSMCWCPITTLGYAGSAYEWMLGQYFSDETRAPERWTSALSADLSAAFAEYLNSLALTCPDGTQLVLEPSENGIFCSGSYYNYLLEIISNSLKDYLNDNFTNSTEKSAYIDELNSGGSWVSYDAKTQNVSVSSIADFALHCKYPFKRVGAFDDIAYEQIENLLFGTPEKERLHFDAVMAEIIEKNADHYTSFSDFPPSFAADCRSDLSQTDALSSGVTDRVDMYDPLYYLCPGKGGFGASKPANFWRINTGIEQGDTSLTTEVNLALALRSCPSVKQTDFTTVWKAGHIFAERTGSYMTNFIAWVNSCCQSE